MVQNQPLIYDIPICRENLKIRPLFGEQGHGQVRCYVHLHVFMVRICRDGVVIVDTILGLKWDAVRGAEENSVNI
jgi:hypothetical protein